VLEWSDQVAFGLVKGAHIFRVEPQRRRRMLGLLSGPSQTRVFLSQEVAGARAPGPAAAPRGRTATPHSGHTLLHACAGGEGARCLACGAPTRPCAAAACAPPCWRFVQRGCDAEEVY